MHRLVLWMKIEYVNLRRKKRVNLVTTACTDQALLTAANVSEKLGLSFYLNSNQARNVTNKFYMKQKV